MSSPRIRLGHAEGIRLCAHRRSRHRRCRSRTLRRRSRSRGRDLPLQTWRKDMQPAPQHTLRSRSPPSCTPSPGAIWRFPRTLPAVLATDKRYGGRAHVEVGRIWCVDAQVVRREAPVAGISRSLIGGFQPRATVLWTSGWRGRAAAWERRNRSARRWAPLLEPRRELRTAVDIGQCPTWTLRTIRDTVAASLLRAGEP